MSATAPLVDESRADTARPARVHWLDGVRALAALYVLLHHIFLNSFPGYPRNTGPWYLGWLIYGQLAVVVFIVVSGYSLSLAPIRNNHRLPGGKSRFARSRAWRILPPYWVALVLSMAIVHFVTAPATLHDTSPVHDVTARTAVVYGALVQNLLPSPVPNGAFWSIAIEAQIYLLFPLLLWLNRKYSSLVTAGVTSLVVSLSFVLAEHVTAFARLNHFTQQLLAGFVLGMVAADFSQRRRQGQLGGRVLGAFALATVALVATAWAVGSPTVIRQYFWVDILVAAIAAVGLAGMTLSPTARLPRLLATPVLTWIGAFSYSLYLIHDPLRSAIQVVVIRPMHLSPLATFWTATAITVPVVLVASHVFFRLFEQPFLTIRSFDAFGKHLASLRGGTR